MNPCTLPIFPIQIFIHHLHGSLPLLAVISDNRHTRMIQAMSLTARLIGVDDHRRHHVFAITRFYLLVESFQSLFNTSHAAAEYNNGLHVIPFPHSRAEAQNIVVTRDPILKSGIVPIGLDLLRHARAPLVQLLRMNCRFAIPLNHLTIAPLLRVR